MANKRIFWAVQAVGFARCGSTSFITAHGVQSVGVNTTFNLDPIKEYGQVEVYENVEGIPEIEVTMEKVLDGYPMLWHLATRGAPSFTLVGRSNEKTSVSLSVYGDTQDAASGQVVTELHMSGMYISQEQITIPVDGNCTESITLVGNNKVWKTNNFLFSGNLFNNQDVPLALTSGWGGVQRRQDVLFDYGSGIALDTNGQVNAQYGGGNNIAATVLPVDIDGISTSGTNNRDSEGNFGSALQRIQISSSLGREAINELGHKTPFFRYVNLPVDVTSEIEVIVKSGDMISATDEGTQGNGDNLRNNTIKVALRDKTFIDLGTKNKLSSVSYSGGDTGGGVVTVTYSYTNQNSLTIRQAQDPTFG